MRATIKRKRGTFAHCCRHFINNHTSLCACVCVGAMLVNISRRHPPAVRNGIGSKGVLDLRDAFGGFFFFSRCFNRFSDKATHNTIDNVLIIIVNRCRLLSISVAGWVCSLASRLIAFSVQVQRVEPSRAVKICLLLSVCISFICRFSYIFASVVSCLACVWGLWFHLWVIYVFYY